MKYNKKFGRFKLKVSIIRVQNVFDLIQKDSNIELIYKTRVIYIYILNLKN